MKKLLLLLLIIPLAFATSWQNVAAMALMVSVTLVAAVYMVGIGFGIKELKIIAKEEFFQVIATALMMVVLAGSAGILDGIARQSAFTDTTTITMANTSMHIISETRAEVVGIFSNIESYDKKVSSEASKGGQCSILGMGYSVSGCGGFAMMATPISMSGNLVGFAIAELSAMEQILKIATTYALNLILPLGILLRTFKITRGAGGFFIALAVSLYIVIPAGVIFASMLSATFEANTAYSDDYLSDYDATVASCNALDTVPEPFIIDLFEDIATAGLTTGGLAASSINELLNSDTNDGKAQGTYFSLRKEMRTHLDIVLVKATMMAVISLLMMAASLKALTSALGAEVDVSAISRFV